LGDAFREVVLAIAVFIFLGVGWVGDVEAVCDFPVILNDVALPADGLFDRVAARC
jgi:hypothetical protein